MSWGKTGVWNCAKLYSYPQAQRHFESRGAVRSKRWQANERPLVGTREKWFKLVKENDYYDLVLYKTPLVRYFKPEDNGDHMVWLRGEYHNKTWQFLRQMSWGCWYSEGLPTVGGQRVVVPLVTQVKEPHGLVPVDWSATLVFNSDDKLILEKSDHRPIAVAHSSTEDKEARKKLTAAVKGILDLMVVRLPTFHAEASIGRQRGWAFGGLGDKAAARKVGETIREVVQLGEELTDEGLHNLLPYCQDVYNTALSKRLEMKEDVRITHYRDSPIIPEHVKPIEPEAFRAALKRSLLRYSGLAKQTGRRVLPKFVDKLPRKYFTAE